MPENPRLPLFYLPADKIRSKRGYGQQNSISVVPDPVVSTVSFLLTVNCQVFTIFVP